MADVCKFEQTVKSLGPGIFFDQKAFEVAQAKIITTLVYGTDNKEVFRVDLHERKAA